MLFKDLYEILPSLGLGPFDSDLQSSNIMIVRGLCYRIYPQPPYISGKGLVVHETQCYIEGRRAPAIMLLAVSSDSWNHTNRGIFSE